MIERLIEIILYIAKEMVDNKDSRNIDLGRLTKKGYSQSEISTAFAWLVERQEKTRSGKSDTRAGGYSIRILSEHEKHLITPEAYGYLLQFYYLGLIDNRDLDLLLERIVQGGFSQIDLPEMKFFISSVLLSPEEPTDRHQQPMFDGEETIH